MLLSAARQRQETLVELLALSVAESDHLAAALTDISEAGFVLRDSAVVAQQAFLEAFRATQRSLELMLAEIDLGLDIREDILMLAREIGDLVANLEEQFVA
jgi:hypothetical protein